MRKKEKMNLDFAKGWKTLAGVLILFAPVINDRFGLNITPELLESLGGEIGTLIGGVIVLYGLFYKITRK